MVNINTLSDRLRTYIIGQIDKIASTNPIIKVTKPIISRIVDNNFSKVKSAIRLIADKDGNVDVEGILAEMIEQIGTTQEFSMDIPILGHITMGNGNVTVNIPMTSKEVKFNTEDLTKFKNVLTTN